MKSPEYCALLTAVYDVVRDYEEFTVRDKSYLGYRMFEIVHKKTRINGDIFEFLATKTGYKRNVPSVYSKYVLYESCIDYPSDWVDDLQQIVFKGMQLYIPNQPDKLLRTYYGDSYIRLDHTCDANCEKCVPV